MLARPQIVREGESSTNALICELNAGEGVGILMFHGPNET